MSPELNHLITLWRDKAAALESDFAGVSPGIASLVADAIRRCAQDVVDLYSKSKVEPPKT